eukprot:322950-Alexandrium_andersonii.AAC.1
MPHRIVTARDARDALRSLPPGVARLAKRKSETLQPASHCPHLCSLIMAANIYICVLFMCWCVVCNTKRNHTTFAQHQPLVAPGLPPPPP